MHLVKMFELSPVNCELLERHPRNHLRDAGLKESGRFAVDQMAKWLSGTPMPGITAIS